MPFNPTSSLAKLLDAPVRPGRLIWIGKRPARREPMEALERAFLEIGGGLVGDRYSNRDGGRQVTLIGTENLAAIGSFLGRNPVPPELLRRNLLVQGLNLVAVKDRRLAIGNAVLEVTGECHPCSRMEEVFGVGGYNAVRGHGGVTARVLAGGEIKLGDPVVRLDAASFTTEGCPP